ncbi:hypothetical protein ACPV40_13605 [Vibrio alfacsensis]|uniref:hypothetical protein n=2 Tax=Vibrio TaxID=662 RepID=UPI0015FF423D|nr:MULTISPECIES: hypothetical protein [unclassified Vibrio]
MERAIYLNDRKYRICDIGEGECTLVITYSDDVESLFYSYSHLYLELERVLIVDISRCWSQRLEEMTTAECELLAKDIQLLADVYWLDEVKVMTECKNESLEISLFDKFYFRKLQMLNTR